MRPEGQPGTVWVGRLDSRPSYDGKATYQPYEAVRLGLSYPAVMTDDGVLTLWRDGRWIESPGYATHFEAGPEWQADCTHDGLVPWKGCDVESDCLSKRREDARREMAES